MIFKCKQFSICHEQQGHKIGTDSLLLGAWVGKVNGLQRALDFGAGSGVLSLMLAQNNPNALITAIEINQIAAAEAQENFKNSPFSKRLKVVIGEVTSIKIIEKAHLVVCNPPYFIENATNLNSQRALARSGAKIDLWLKNAFLNTSDNGILCICFPANLANYLKILFIENGWWIKKQVMVSRKEGKRAFLALFQVQKSYYNDWITTKEFLFRQDDTKSIWFEGLMEPFLL